MAGGEGLQIACVKLKLCADNSTEHFRGVCAFWGLYLQLASSLRQSLPMLICSANAYSCCAHTYPAV